ncbi:hypothetical protein [Streptomyces sedi]|uniref:hypothetical protein n=1 Tax=Streptomyces sedi TaxID=555059 RepID=UPI001FEA245A|nr:hypothetical protein [Streptomyces sedi]
MAVAACEEAAAVDREHPAPGGVGGTDERLDGGLRLGQRGAVVGRRVDGRVVQQADALTSLEERRAYSVTVVGAVALVEDVDPLGGYLRALHGEHEAHAVFEEVIAEDQRPLAELRAGSAVAVKEGHGGADGVEFGRGVRQGDGLQARAVRPRGEADGRPPGR